MRSCWPGSPAQKERYLRDAAAGTVLGAFALTEPGAGSSPADMTTRAIEAEGTVHLTGVKHFISNAGAADFIIVFARGAGAGPRPVIDAFILEKGTAGLSFGAPEPTMGMRGGHIFEIALDCRIPASQRLGEPGSGFRTAMQVLDRGRIEVAAMALGISEAAMAATPGLGQAAQDRRQPAGRSPGRAMDAGRYGNRDRGRPASHFAGRRLAPGG